MSKRINRTSGFSLSAAWRALKYRNYKLFFGGQIISLTGTWTQQIAMSWLVYRLTNSAFMLGLISFASQIPSLILSPFAGIIVDKLNRHKILITTQSLAMLQAFLLVFLLITSTVEVWHLIVLNLFLGIVNGFDTPARQAFVVEMIENKEDLGNAIALNSMMFNAARLFGPSVAGILLAETSETICFLINGISFFAVIAALLAMKIDYSKVIKTQKNVLEGLKEGFKYTFSFTPTKYLILLVALVSLTGMPYVVLMPVFAKNILHGGPNTLGFLMGSIGAGALLGALLLASKKSVLGLGRIVLYTTFSFGVTLIAFSFSRSLILSMFFLILTGMSMIIRGASSNTIIQTIIDDDKRGRVMSFYTMAFMGMMPFGSLLFGILASKFGAPTTLVFGGISCILGSLLFALKLPKLRKAIRPIYSKLGILPELAEGLQTTTNLRVPPQN
ncbi:MFS transporter [Melioribacteraceae bacterium 4301-Me]|uniref:MFS transporter n=1 Tax=Pyranulibacter aquaticus TaxID=3163344 RepID=UPI003598CC11